MSKKATTSQSKTPVQAPQAKTSQSNIKASKEQAPKPSVIKGSFDPAQFSKGGIPEDQVLEIKAAFDLFDSDQGGWIDTKELKAAMVSLGFDTKNGAVFQMITDLDSDGNGGLDFSEFFALMTTKISDKNSRAQYTKVFNMYDDDKKGYLTSENLARVAADLGENISAEQIQELIKRADIDHDGVVSEEEFYAIMTRQL